MSNNTGEWLHFQPNNDNTASLGLVAPSYAAMSSPDIFSSGLVTEATAVATASPPDPAQMGPAGRVTKPARRRTRASRRTPTTLINTDTSNFRAMVQQFTGGPGPQGLNVGPGFGYGAQFPVGQLQYAGATTSNNNNNNNNNMSNTSNIFMQDNYNAYAANTDVKGGSSSSENRSNYNFHF